MLATLAAGFASMNLVTVVLLCTTGNQTDSLRQRFPYWKPFERPDARSRTSCHGNFENLRQLEVRTHHSHSYGIYGYVWHDAQAILSADILPPSSSRRQIGGIWLRLWHSYGGYAPSRDWGSHRSEFAWSELPKSTLPAPQTAGPLPPCPTDFPFKPEGRGYPSNRSANTEVASAGEQRAPSPRSLCEGLRPTASFPMVFPQPVLLPDPATPRNSGRDRSDMRPESTPILTSRLPVVRYARDARNPGVAPVCL